MKTLDINQSVKKVHKALTEPINTLAKILKEKLKGSYDSFNVDLGELDRLDTIYSSKAFPGYCRMDSNDRCRHLNVCIKFEWNDWKGEECLEFTSGNGFLGNAKPIHLNNAEFIEELKAYLNGTKSYKELCWE